MPRYTPIFRCPECEKKLPIKCDGLKDDTPAKIRQRNPTFEKMLCSCGHIADYQASAAIEIGKDELIA